ncbi:MAG: hypothetical protein HC853_08480 [Anaerolineae bacterium]|nr:hypothetical protein [Anaerolineae bacterium]
MGWLEILPNTITRKFRRFPSLFDSPKTVMEGFAQLFRRFADSTIVVSYSSNGIPHKTQLAYLLSQYKTRVEVHECDHRYSFGTQTRQNQNAVKEYLFIGT